MCFYFIVASSSSSPFHVSCSCFPSISLCVCSITCTYNCFLHSLFLPIKNWSARYYLYYPIQLYVALFNLLAHPSGCCCCVFSLSSLLTFSIAQYVLLPLLFNNNYGRKDYYLWNVFLCYCIFALWLSRISYFSPLLLLFSRVCKCVVSICGVCVCVCSECG